jgi:hypothetical protein
MWCAAVMRIPVIMIIVLDPVITIMKDAAAATMITDLSLPIFPKNISPKNTLSPV